tara:strand:- start:46494 stop:47807 length:1314 start_codon:yes stop_codon:yes gene_type:complete
MGHVNGSNHIEPAIRSQIGRHNIHVDDIKMLSRVERQRNSDNYLRNVMAALREHGARGSLANMETALIKNFNKVSSDGHNVSTYLVGVDIDFALNRDSFKNSCFYNFHLDLGDQLGLHFNSDDRIETTPMITDLAVFQDGKRLVDEDVHPGYMTSIPGHNLYLEFHDKNGYVDDSNIHDICLRTRFRNTQWKNAVMGRHKDGSSHNLRFSARILVAIQVDEASDKLLVHFNEDEYKKRCERMGLDIEHEAYEDRFLPLNSVVFACRATKVGSGLSKMWLTKEQLEKRDIYASRVKWVKHQTAVNKQQSWLERERAMHGKPCYMLNSLQSKLAYALPLEALDEEGMMALNFNLWGRPRYLIGLELYVQNTYKVIEIDQKRALEEQAKQEAFGEVYQPSVTEATAGSVVERPKKTNTYRSLRNKFTIPNLSEGAICNQV